LWKKFKPEKLATLEAFMSNPQLVWEWYQFRRNMIERTEPNPAHYALVEFGEFFESLTLITQNVDGLHQKAGSNGVVELHGNITRNKCMDCGRRCDDLTQAKPSTLPKCPCGGSIRPDVVWFGEALPADALNMAFKRSSDCRLFFSIGTSAVVYPAALLPQVAKRNGAYVVEINMSRTELSNSIDEIILGKAGEILPRFVEYLKEKQA